jgi:TonB-linked SusC/RagA family outer membrane protein
MDTATVNTSETMKYKYNMNFSQNIRAIFAFLMILFMGMPAMSQTLVKGTIISASDGFTLPGASVVELDKNNRVVNGVISDAFGNYVLPVSSTENSIQFSFIGFQPKIENIGDRTTINVSLSDEDMQIEEVVVRGSRSVSDGFMNIKEKNLTTSVQRIDAKIIEDIPATSIDEAMQGQLAGVDITASSGDPGAGMSIRIRGTSSINSSSEPLIVVNNVPFDTEIDNDFDFTTADEEGYAQMLNVSPDDIKEIAVLKDAAATAQWGSRAANGVIMITTKRGVKGDPQIRYSYKHSIAEQPDQIPMLNGDQYSTLILEGYMNKDGRPLPSDTRELRYDPDWSEFWNYNQNTDWVKAITRTGITQDHNLSLTGGGEKARYRISVGYLDQSGTTLGTDLTRLSTMINLDYYVSDKISFITDLSYNRGENSKNYPDLDNDEYELVRSVAYKKMPNMSIYERNAEGESNEVFFSPSENVQGGWPDTYNPVAMSEKGLFRISNNRIIPKFGVRYNILTNLRYNFDVSFDVNNDKSRSFLPQVSTGKAWTDPSVNRAGDKDADAFSVQTFNKLYYEPNLGDRHSLMLMGSITSYDKRSQVYQFITTNTASSELRDPSVVSRIVNAEDIGINSGKSQNRTVAGLFIFSYDFEEKYILSGSVRRDGSSKFGAGKRFGTFPAISARWRISDESFMQSLAFLNDLSLRASYGENGNAPGKSYTQFNSYTTYDYNYLGQPAVYAKSMELANKKWETTIQKNIGMNIILFENRINVDFDFYQKRTKDLFFEKLKIPSSSGYTEIGMNAGTMDNQGFEINVMTTLLDIKASDFKFDLNFNFARNVNIIREISELYPTEKGVTTKNGEYLSRLQIDNPVGSFYGYRYLGVYEDEEATIARDVDGNLVTDINGNPVYMSFNYPATVYQFQPGDAIYEDINHDGNIDAYDVVYLGDANPLFTGGFGTFITYKDFTLNSSFHYRYGNDIINQARMDTENMYGYDNQSQAVLRRWRNLGDQTDIPRALINGGYNYLGSNRFVEDGSFVRLKFVNLTYSIPKNWIQKAKLKQLKVGVTLKNLYTWTNYSGQDPEISPKGSDPFQIGYDKSRTPRPKELSFNLSVTF